MSRYVPDGRLCAPELAWLLREDEGVRVLCAPKVGAVRDLPPRGTRVQPGDVAGALEVLGVQHRLVVPEGAGGFVEPCTAPGPRRARLPVAYGEPVLRLKEAAAEDVGPAAPSAAAAGSGGMGPVLRALSSGRFYRRPAPDADPFVRPGDVVRHGDVVGLLEVMKTFGRVVYEGAGLPSPAKVLQIHPDDGADVDEGDPLVTVEPVGDR